MKISKLLLLLMLLALLLAVDSALPPPVLAQDSLPDEPDTEAFITANFILQSEYNAVHCVAQNGDCPPDLTVTVPCLTAACANPALNYDIQSQHETIQSASDIARPGDLIIIMPGRYAGVNVENTGGETGAYIHFLGMGEAGSVVIDRPADPSLSWLRHHFYFINTHHYIIDNLSFTGAEEGAGIFFSGFFSETGTFSHHMIVQNVYSHDNYSWGMHTTATSYVLVQDSIFTNSADEHGFYVSGSGDDMVIRRNVFQGNTSSGLQVNADPQTATAELFYFLDYTTGDTCGWTEADVEFTGNAQWDDLFACYEWQGYGGEDRFYEDGISENLIIEQNIITGNGAAGGGGINLASVRHSYIRNNLIYGNDAAGITCWDNAYAEEKDLASSQFGCHDVWIIQNSIVDEVGGRGALIINHDARDMRVYNNILIRDRFDTYEIAVNSGSGLRSGNNYYFAQYIEESPGFNGDENSVTGFTVQEGISQFANPNFEPWILAQGDGYIFNSDRPDFRLNPNSSLLNMANLDVRPLYDLMGNPRANEIGALVASTEVMAGDTENATAVMPAPNENTNALDTSGTVVFRVGEQVFMIREGERVNVSATLDAIATGQDDRITISPDGQWLLIETTRFDPECMGWACWTLLNSDFSTYEVIYVDGMPLHSWGNAAVASDGNLIVFEEQGGTNQVDLFAVERDEAGNWGTPILLTADSPYPFNTYPALSDDAQGVVMDCGNQPYSESGTAICEYRFDSSAFRVVISPEDTGNEFSAMTALHHPDYAPDGSIVFESDWQGEQLWRIAPNASTPVLISGEFNNDNSPCVLPNGNIVSLWLGREGGEGLHEMKLMTSDGTQYAMFIIDEDVLDGGIACAS